MSPANSIANATQDISFKQTTRLVQVRIIQSIHAKISILRVSFQYQSDDFWDDEGKIQSDDFKFSVQTHIIRKLLLNFCKMTETLRKIAANLKNIVLFFKRGMF